MKSFIVFSDVHGDATALEKLKPLIRENDGAIFTGDGIDGLHRLSAKELYAVRGNCDGSGSEELVVEIEGVRAFITHGHLYGVKRDYLRLALRARELGCSLALFGHTHEACVQECNGVLLVNPGSCSYYSARRTFAYLVINGERVSAFINDSTLN